MGSLWLDVEVYADREADLLELLAELNEDDDGVDGELPPIIIDCPPSWEGWGEAA